MIKIKRVFFLLAAFSAACVANAASLQDLVSKSDLIVVGAVQTRTESEDEVRFDILVQRVLKGEQPPPVLHVTHAWKQVGVFLHRSSASPIDAELDGIWFLQKDATTWDVLPVRGPDGIIPDLFLPAVLSDSETATYAASTPVTDKVVLELGAALHSSNVQPEVLLQTLGGLDSGAVDKVVNDFLQSSNDAFHAVALSVLLDRGKLSGLQYLGSMWPGISKAEAKDHVIFALRESFRNTTPESTTALVGIATRSASSPDLRAAAIHALSAMHTKESVPFLASLLTSSDPNDQLQAIIGISSFANGCPAQTPANIASLEYMHFTNPSPYRNDQTIASFAFGPVESQRQAELAGFWSTWWTEHKADFSN
jgi:HEAT repeats